MTQQHVQQVPVTTDSPEVFEQLRRAVDEMSTSKATQRALSLGVTPPTGDSGWEMLPQFEADGSEGPLMWVRVTEPGDHT